MQERQALTNDRCFRFFADTGKRVAVKTRDSDRFLVGGSVYIIAGDASTNLVVRHERHRQAEPDATVDCEHPLVDVESQRGKAG